VKTLLVAVDGILSNVFAVMTSECSEGIAGRVEECEDALKNSAE
jgi:hypothetical protein